jgi:hypothetical protein
MEHKHKSRFYFEQINVVGKALFPANLLRIVINYCALPLIDQCEQRLSSSKERVSRHVDGMCQMTVK